ncbi:hypothetical protein Goshw_016091, partial [Gossypium schwendimanii]|nr:hypothetical protein [Gossypium schwendimanii]
MVCMLKSIKQGFKLRSWSRFRSRRVCRGRGHNGRYCGYC